MIGGLSKALTFKNVNGSCLIDCTLNSILNSHEMVVRLYKLTSSNVSLSDPFSIILSGIESATHGIIYKYLFSAFVHDYINDKNRGIDKNKFIFIMKQKDEYMRIDKLDEKYERFVAENIRLDMFIAHSGNISSRHIIDMDDDLDLNNILVHFKDIYIVLFTRGNEYKTVLDLNKREIRFARKMIKSAITSTGDYICTDMILYKGNDSSLIEYSHVVYYNILYNTLIDNHVRSKLSLRDIYIPNRVRDYVSYIETTHSHTVYIPCVLHYQKIANNAKILGLIGKLKTYELHTQDRINFIKEQLSTYTEEWYQDKVLAYKNELS